MSQKYVVIDLETTGNSPKKGDRIIQIGAVIIEDGKITGKYSSLVNPGRSIPVFIEELTGISESMVNDAPAFKEIGKEIAHMLNDAYFVAHNVLFDLSFLQEEFIGAGLAGFFGPVLDTVELARILYPTADSYKLTDLAARENLTHDQPHRADSDALVTAELLLVMLDMIKKLPHVTLKELAKLSSGLKSDLHLVFEDEVTLKEKGFERLPPDIMIHRGIALRMVEVVQERDCPQLVYPRGHEDKEKILKMAIEKFESREGQFEMMDIVYEAFSKKGHALIEAGTGVGKSLAYLVPATVFSKEKNVPIVISTYTTQLQEQLLTNDVPILEKIFDCPLNIALIKGRSHYINMAKFEQSLRMEEENYDTALTKMQILVWLIQTETGDADELNLSSGGLLFWNKIRNERSLFIHSKSWHKYDYYRRAIQKAKSADLLITNHALLLSDLVSEQGTLPSYQYVILDEGHQFEKAAGKYFGQSLDFMSLRLLLNQLGQYEQGQLFHRLEAMLGTYSAYRNKVLRKNTIEMKRLIADLSFETDELFKLAGIYARKAIKSRTAGSRIYAEMKEDRNNRTWMALQTAAERFYFLLKDVGSGLEERLEVAEGMNNLSREDKALLEEVVQIKTSIDIVQIAAKALFIEDYDQSIRWIEADVRSLQNSSTIYTRPANVASYLSERFFHAKQSVILTSASLTVNKSFQYIKKELGLTSPYIEKQIESPFNYKKQVSLIVPEDLPDIKTVSDDEYIAAITEHIISIAEATRGRMLVLFTSHEMLKKTYEIIKDSGLLEDFILIAQGITAGSRTRLTRNFKRFDKAILFGTSSFWEGVDIPGEDLSCLIMVRLPFSPPDEPLTAAKSARIKKQGGNPFSDLALPEAILRFKQGFGRLIRTSTDKGMIFVFDRRILTTAYGKSFLTSIPHVTVRKGSISEIIDYINEWL